MFTKELALMKIKHFCAYRERCHAEVSQKLVLLGLHENQAQEIITQLTEENFLNEERFAIAYAGGKFRLKQWGRVKIKYALKQKHVADHCIKKALKQIDEHAYKKTIKKLAVQKANSLLKTSSAFDKKRRLCDYLLQKGFEGTIIKEVLANPII